MFMYYMYALFCYLRRSWTCISIFLHEDMSYKGTPSGGTRGIHGLNETPRYVKKIIWFGVILIWFGIHNLTTYIALYVRIWIWLQLYKL